MFCPWYIFIYICNHSVQSARLSILSSELGPHSLIRKRLLLPLLGPRGETHSLAGEGLGNPIPTMGQTLWYSRCTLIHLLVQYIMLIQKHGPILFVRILSLIHASLYGTCSSSFHQFFWTGDLFRNQRPILLYQKISAMIKKNGGKSANTSHIRKFWRDQIQSHVF
jgi:hypothetical protein